jgi:hypothetical protein
MKKREDAWSLPRRRVLGALVAPLLMPAVASAQSRSPVRTRPASTSRFRINVPQKDWRLLPGGICSHGSLAHKDSTVAIVIEHEMLRLALGPEEIDKNFAELELAALKEREAPGATFEVSVAPLGGRRAVTIDYQRRGLSAAERVRVYVVVEKIHLYRLICVAPANQFARHEATFQAVCSSFAPVETAASSAG